MKATREASVSRGRGLPTLPREEVAFRGDRYLEQYDHRDDGRGPGHGARLAEHRAAPAFSPCDQRANDQQDRQKHHSFILCPGRQGSGKTGQDEQAREDPPPAS